MNIVLFVCVGNSSRSQMAEGLFNHLAPAGWLAKSAGTQPASSASTKAVGVMTKRGINISKHQPKLLTNDMLALADRIISMGCGVDLCPYDLYAGVVNWEIDDPDGKPYDTYKRVREDIEFKVRGLIEEIASLR